MKDNHHKIICISALKNSNIVNSPPKLERDFHNCETKISHCPIWDDSTNGYPLIKKTQEILEEIYTTKLTTIEKIIIDLNDVLSKQELNIHEIYTNLAQHSFWEVIKFMIDSYPISKISKNDHKFNVIYKILKPVWMVQSYHIDRTIEDVYKTMKLLIEANLIDSMLTPTPRKTNLNYNNKHIFKDNWETPFVTLIQLFHNDCNDPMFQKFYKLMYYNLSPDRINEELNFLLPQLKNNLDVFDKDKLGCEFKWIMTQNLEIFVQRFQGFELENKREILISILKNNLNIYKTFDTYFIDNPWGEGYILFI